MIARRLIKTIEQPSRTLLHTTTAARYAKVEPNQADAVDPTSPPSAARGQVDDVAPAKELQQEKETLASTYLDLTSLTNASPGDKQKRRSMSSIERKRQNYSRITSVLTLLGLGYGVWYIGRDWDSEEEKNRLLGRHADVLKDMQEGRWLRTKARGVDLADYFNKPAWEPLLPPPLGAQYQRPYTLVIELDDLLVHSEWSREGGWRTAKRPGFEDFLGYLGQFYEIVVFTETPSYTAMPILDKLDPLQYYVHYRLFRDSTRYYNKGLVKDLSYLGRDLSKVIIMDTDPARFQNQPENAILIPPWKGGRSTSSNLLDYLPFLEAIGINAVKDVRPVLKAYEGKDVPKVFAARQAEIKRQHIEEWEKEREASKGNPLAGFSFASMFGLAGARPTQPQNKNEPPLTFYEAERQRYLEHYMKERDNFRANEKTYMSQMEAEKDKMLKDSKSSFFGFMANLGGPPPGTNPPTQGK